MNGAPAESRLIGITGGIGVGKSAFRAALTQLGYATLDADHLNRELLSRPAVSRAIQEAFPDEALIAADGALRKDLLRARIVRDPAAKAALEAIMHPRIAAELRARYRSFTQAAPGGAWLFYEASLLFEAGRESDFDAIVVVDAPLPARLRRLQGPRGLSEEVARGLVGAQLDQGEKVRRATVVACNPDDSAHDLQGEALRVLSALRAYFLGSPPPA